MPSINNSSIPSYLQNKEEHKPIITLDHISFPAFEAVGNEQNAKRSATPKAVKSLEKFYFNTEVYTKERMQRESSQETQIIEIDSDLPAIYNPHMFLYEGIGGELGATMVAIELFKLGLQGIEIVKNALSQKE